jgi:hypothetical protein
MDNTTTADVFWLLVTAAVVCTFGPGVWRRLVAVDAPVRPVRRLEWYTRQEPRRRVSDAVVVAQVVEVVHVAEEAPAAVWVPDVEDVKQLLKQLGGRLSSRDDVRQAELILEQAHRHGAL